MALVEIENYSMESHLCCTSFCAIFQHRKQSCPCPRKTSSVDFDPPLTVVVLKTSEKPPNKAVTPRSSTSKTSKSSDTSRSSTSSLSSSSGSDQVKRSSNPELTEKMNGGDHETKPSYGDLLINPDPINITSNQGSLKQSNLVNKNLLDGKPMRNASKNGVVLRARNVSGNGDTPRKSYVSSNGVTPRCSNVGGNGATQRVRYFSAYGMMGNIIMKPASEALNHLGNKAYKQGKFQEALALYDRAIPQEPSNLIYRCNRTDALIALGRLSEAIDECNEALRLDPNYDRTHRRLARVYVRLGKADEAISEFLKSGSYANKLNETGRGQTIKQHLNKCIEARNEGNWQTLLRETCMALLAGADSAPRIYALRAEALLKLNKHQEAAAACQKVLVFPIDFYIKIFGRVITAYLSTVAAQVCYSVGRSDDALARAQQAAELDPSNQEVRVIIDKVEKVSSARQNGNLLYYASKFSEACTIYSKGLELNPYNSVLLCNRAACRYSLGQFETALEDCNTALDVDPSYSKARRRRADCYTKVERWEAAIADYEMLVKEFPNDQDIARAVFDAKVQLKRSRGEDTTKMRFGSNLVSIKNIAQFRQCVASPEKFTSVLQLIEQLCKKFTSVEVDEHHDIMRSECVNYNIIPAFKIYKNGSRTKEIAGNKEDLLEELINMHFYPSVIVVVVSSDISSNQNHRVVKGHHRLGRDVFRLGPKLKENDGNRDGGVGGRKNKKER
ncbi:hypothetical protein ACFE04_025445 [Oxalis oulophora]